MVLLTRLVIHSVSAYIKRLAHTRHDWFSVKVHLPRVSSRPHSFGRDQPPNLAFQILQAVVSVEDPMLLVLLIPKLLVIDLSLAICTTSVGHCLGVL